MKRFARLAVLAFAPLLMAAIWMDDQPSFKPYETPVSPPPAGSVPVSGRETDGQGGGAANPVAPAPASVAQGKRLYEINCAMCHGLTLTKVGPVGDRLKPPPPRLDQELLKTRSDSHIFRAVTSGFGRMPPFRDKLTPLERWHLVNFLRARR